MDKDDILKNYQNPDIWFFTLIEAFPQLDVLIIKLKAMRYINDFGDNMEQVRTMLKTMCDATNELKNSQELSPLLKLILQLTNTLKRAPNCVIPSGDMQYLQPLKGFYIESVTKLNGMRAYNKPEITLLHYLIAIIQMKNTNIKSELQLQTFMENMPHVQEASAFTFQEVEEIFKSLRKGKTKFLDVVLDLPKGAADLSHFLVDITVVGENLTKGEAEFSTLEESFKRNSAFYGAKPLKAKFSKYDLDMWRKEEPMHFFSILSTFGTNFYAAMGQKKMVAEVVQLIELHNKLALDASDTPGGS
jgi:hypothetical protein